MPSAIVLAMQAQRYVTHNTIGQGAHETSWTFVLAGLIPILGIAAAGIIIYALVRKEREPEPSEE